jgi:hypothetical protein
MQLMITACAVCVAAAAVAFVVATARQERNAALVTIGVAVLRTDPAKAAQVTAAREWALDLIDANAGGVKFSTEDRKELLQRRLYIPEYNSAFIPAYDSTFIPDYKSTFIPGAPAPTERKQPEPPNQIFQNESLPLPDVG